MKSKFLQLSPKQWKLLSSVFSNVGQAILLFAAAAFFVPRTVGLQETYSKINSSVFIVIGLLFIVVAVIIVDKEKT